MCCLLPLAAGACSGDPSGDAEDGSEAPDDPGNPDDPSSDAGGAVVTDAPNLAHDVPAQFGALAFYPEALAWLPPCSTRRCSERARSSSSSVAAAAPR